MATWIELPEHAWAIDLDSVVGIQRQHSVDAVEPVYRVALGGGVIEVSESDGKILLEQLIASRDFPSPSVLEPRS